METELREAMTSGVFVEFCDERGNCVAQSVYLDWHSRPVPAVGDQLTCSVTSSTTGRSSKFSGQVRARQFDLQRDAEGGVSVWVRLIVDLPARSKTSRKPALLRYTPMMFSDN
jgi:hypothetical protein